MVTARTRITPMRYLRPFLTASPSDEREFVTKLTNQMGEGFHAVPLGRARVAIFLLVKYALSEQRRYVLLSPYTIPEVIDMVVLAGGTPIFFDNCQDSTNADVNQIVESLNDKIACLLLTHHHVNQPEAAAIYKACRQYGVLYFEDCAIAFGGKNSGEPVGSFSDAAMFSFSFFKSVNFFWGGAILTKNEDISRYINYKIKNWPGLKWYQYLVPAARYLVIDIATQPKIFENVTFPLIRIKTRQAKEKSITLYPRGRHLHFDANLMSRPGLAAFSEWLRKFDQVHAANEHRQRIAEVYDTLLTLPMASCETPAAVRSGSCYVNYPVVVGAAERNHLVRQLMRGGFDVGLSLYPNCHEFDRFRSVAGRSERVAALVRSTISLPTHFAVTEHYAAELGRAIESLT